MWRRHHRERLYVHQPAQHFETRIPPSGFTGGQKRRVGRAMYPEQVKVVRRQRQPAYSDDRPATTKPQ